MSLLQTGFPLLQTDFGQALLKSEHLRAEDEFLKSVEYLKKIVQFHEKGRGGLKRQRVPQESLQNSENEHGL